MTHPLPDADDLRAQEASAATASGLDERGNWLAEVTRRMEAATQPPGGQYGHVFASVAASVAVGFAADVADLLAERSGQTDRIGDHYRVEGWIDDEGSRDDYCGFCSIDGSPGAPAHHFAWPCDAVRRAVCSSDDERLIGLRGQIDRKDARLRFVDAANADLRTEIRTLRADLGDAESGVTTYQNGLRADLRNAHTRYAVVKADRDQLLEKVAELDEAVRLMAEGREGDAVSYRAQLAQVRDRRDELAASNGHIDPTPGQVTAYIRAVREKMRTADFLEPAYPATVRAGLAAVQWALLNPTTTDSGVEVSAADATVGDRITITGTVGAGEPDDTLMVELWGRNYWLTETDVVFTRPAPPLPTVPGSVVEATFRGRTVKLALTDDPDDACRWFTVAGYREGEPRWVRSDELTAVRILSTPEKPGAASAILTEQRIADTYFATAGRKSTPDELDALEARLAGRSVDDQHASAAASALPYPEETP